MKALTKQILSVLLASGTLMSASNAFAVIPEDVQGTRFEEPVQLLSALKIMNGDENGLFRLDDTIIRSEVTKMAIHAIGLEETAEASKGGNDFEDVSSEHWANGYINLATSLGLVEGDGDGKFRPNEPITYAEAMTILVRATGYEKAAQDKGGYPNGYISVGTSNGMGKNVTGSASQEISRGNVAFLTVNSLDVNLMEQTGFGAGAQYEITDKTLLKDKLKVEKLEGQIEAIENTSLTGNSSLSKGQLKIGDKVYDTAYNMNNLLGYNVDYYVKDTGSGNGEIILAVPQKNRNTVLTVNSDLFSQVTTKNSNIAVEYFRDENSSKTLTAELDANATLIYNGKYETMDANLLNIADEAGDITLLDANKDGKYEIAFVTVYNNMVVEEVTSSNKIVDKYTGNTLKLDENVDFRITKGFDEIGLEDLNEYDVLSIAGSKDKELYNIIVTNKTVEGKVSASDDNGFYINGEHYKVAKNYTETIKIGLEGTFYLDVEGKIAAVDTAGISDSYAYLVKAYTSESTEVSSFKLFTADGKEVTLEANDKVKFNGQSGKKAEDVVNSLTLSDGKTDKQLVTYSTNSEDKLTALQTATDTSGAIDVNKFSKNQTLTDAKYSATLSKLGNVRIDDSTIVFEIPNDSTDYAVRSKDLFEDEQKYNAIVYDMTENYTAKVVVVTNAAFNANADASLAVVSKVASATNGDDEQTDLLVALVDGKEVSMYADEEGILVKENGDKLEAGDLIQYKTNSDGEIVSVRVLLDIQDKDTEATNTPAENLETVYGKVTKKFSDSVNVTVNDGNTVNYELSSDIPVYQVDTKRSKNNVEIVSVGDIQNYDAEENNRIFLKIYKDVVTEAVIIK